MPSVSSRFNNTLSVSNFSNIDNVLVDGAGSATFTANAECTFLGFPSGVGPTAIPDTATITGIKYFVGVTPSSGNVSFTFTAKKGASQTGDDETGVYTISQTQFFGGENDLLGLTIATPNDAASFRLVVQFGTVTGTAVLGSVLAQFHYTLPFSNKIYNTSGKLSITSGKVSLT